jgi:hypothetical protein
MTIRKIGVDEAHADFVIPIAIINLYSEKGVRRNISHYIRMGGTFNTAIRAAYDDAQGIMGTPFVEDTELLGKIKGAGLGFLSGVASQVQKAAFGAGGMVASAGQSGRQQLEFLSRVFLSNFQQVVYRGPSFRIFTLPFTMKPTSAEEAATMRDIIFDLKGASVPKVGSVGGATTAAEAAEQLLPKGVNLTFNEELDRTARITQLEATLKTGKDEEKVAAQNELDSLDATRDFISQADAQNFKVSDSSPFTFGYPDVVDFSLALYKSGSPGILKTVFQSKKCVIEAVTMDYGSSNKMTFFQDNYYPTEVNLTLNLKELEFQTTKSIAEYKADAQFYNII